MSDEKNKTRTNHETSANDESAKELLNFKKICSSRCTICNSGFLKEIHEMRKNGKEFNVIIDELKRVQKFSVSMSSLSRHFKTYRTFKNELAMEIIKHDTLEEITTQSVHIRKTVELLDIVYEKILFRLKADNYVVDISDLEKLAKMRYQILNGENPDDNGLVALFQKASDKYGLNLEQGVLFKG